MGINLNILERIEGDKLKSRYSTAERRLVEFMENQAKDIEEGYTSTAIVTNKDLPGRPSLILNSKKDWFFLTDSFEYKPEVLGECHTDAIDPLLYKYALLRKKEFRSFVDEEDALDYLKRNKDDLMSGLCTEMELKLQELTREI